MLTQTLFSPKNMAFRLDSCLSDTTATPNCQIILCGMLIFQVTKSYCDLLVWHCNALPGIISKPRLFGGLVSAACWLSRATGSQNGLILILRELPLLSRR